MSAFAARLSDESLLERFWSRVDKAGPDDCWEFTGASRNRMGHRHLWHDGSTVYAHRLSFEIHHGEIPDGHCVCHACDNPPCVNPAHLFSGTRQDNIDDMVAKGRHSTNPPTGIEHHNAVHPDEAVRRAVRMHRGGMSQREVARRFGVSQVTIHRWCRGHFRRSATHPDRGGDRPDWDQVAAAAAALGVR